jgi:hypothetical protein
MHRSFQLRHDIFENTTVQLTQNKPFGTARRSCNRANSLRGKPVAANGVKRSGTRFEYQIVGCHIPFRTTRMDAVRLWFARDPGPWK